MESALDCGLVRGHAYGITALKKVRLGERLAQKESTARLLMVRMRNPWGTADWTGAWSQGWVRASGFGEILAIRLGTLASLLPQVTGVAADEPQPQGEDGPPGPRRGGVLVPPFSRCYRSGLPDPGLKV